MPFPIHRPRRLRRTEALRSLVRETRLSARSLVYPLFVCPGSGVKDEIRSMPGNYRWSIDLLAEECRDVAGLGVPAVILFGIPEDKDEVGTGAYAADGIVQRAVRAVKQSVPDLLVICDVCLDEYTSHGHCGLIRDGEVDNDSTLELLARTAVTQVQAGADMVAPSDMMDGRVARIRSELDAAGFAATPIMAYSAKYASGFYGPFREAADSAPKFGDRKSYQMDPANQREAMREIALDIEEGADIIMVKPALAYLDVIARARQEFDVPIAAYQVSGEFSMIEAAARNGWIDRERIIMETLLSIHRAGADIILTYFAKDVARMSNG
ncbi:MAG TPA: porphobilinogen synthase [Terriglobia bacterium]|jgi:porphobilinogen synthase|nr:porphobilinogen synthase [Terriglobia bacterium]